MHKPFDTYWSLKDNKNEKKLVLTQDDWNSVKKKTFYNMTDEFYIRMDREYGFMINMIEK